MSELSNETIATLDAFWAFQTSCRREDFDTEGVAVVECPATDGSEYVQVFRHERRLQITCSASLVGTIREAVGGQPSTVVFDPGFLRRALGRRVDRIVGPAYLGYLDTITPAPDDPDVRPLGAGDVDVLEGLRGSVTAQEWEYSGLEPGQPTVGYFVAGALVSAAGYEVWGGQIAHIGVVSGPDARRNGYGRRCVRAIATHAVAHGMIAQYRTLYDNVGAMAIADALGFREYAATIYVVTTAT